MNTGSKDFGATFDLGARGMPITPVQSGPDFLTEYWTGSGGLPTGAPWKRHVRTVYSSTPIEHGVSAYACIRCSITGDVFERPSRIETFTAPDSEWVSTFDHDRPPVFIVVLASAGAGGTDRPSEPVGNAGYLAVLWLRDFFQTNQKAAMSYAGVPEATFYVWKNNPASSVRSSGARKALKLRASLELAISRMGAGAVRSFVAVGHPSIDERLRGSSGSPWEQAVAEIAQFGTHDVPPGVPRISSPEEYLRRVRQVEDGAIGSSEGDGARLMDEDEILHADREGW